MVASAHLSSLHYDFNLGLKKLYRIAKKIAGYQKEIVILI